MIKFNLSLTPDHFSNYVTRGFINNLEYPISSIEVSNKGFPKILKQVFCKNLEQFRIFFPQMVKI